MSFDLGVLFYSSYYIVLVTLFSFTTNILQ